MNKQNLLSIALVLLAGLLLASAALAQTGGDPSTLLGTGYDLTWHTVDGGGGRLTGGNYTLVGTAGQPEPGPALTGGDYTLYNGFWPGAGAAPSPAKKYIYLPLVLRNH